MKIKTFKYATDNEINTFVDNLEEEGCKTSIRTCGLLTKGFRIITPVIVTWTENKDEEMLETKKFDIYTLKEIAKKIDDEKWKDLKNAKQRELYLHQHHDIPPSKVEDLINVKIMMDKGLI